MFRLRCSSSGPEHRSDCARSLCINPASMATNTPLAELIGSSAVLTSSMELFYLTHMRSCAAAAIGNKSTSRGMASCLCMSGLQCLYHCLAKLIADVLACLLRILEITPLEIASCCVLMVSSYDNAFLIALALLILALAALDWHVAVGHLIAMANLYIPPRGRRPSKRRGCAGAGAPPLPPI